jgi:hypothetical protein
MISGRLEPCVRQPNDQQTGLGHGTRRDTLYAMLEEHRATVSSTDVMASWFATGLVGLGLLGLSGPP